MFTRPGCLGKVAYETRAEADDRRHAVMRRRKGGDPLSVYHCGVCGAFHLGRDKSKATRPHLRTKPHYARAGKKLLARYLELTAERT